MAIKQFSRPYLHGYDLGVGVDRMSGSPMGQVVRNTASPVENASGGVVDIRIERIQSTEELESILGIDVEASFGLASFGAGASARFNYAKKTAIQASSLFLSVSVNVELGFLSIDDPVLTEHADGTLGNPTRFQERYGDAFIRGMARGGLFVGVLRVDTRNETESEQISSSLNGAYKLFSLDAKAKFEELSSAHQTQCFIQMYHEGGPIDLKIVDPTDPRELLNNANLFLESFRTHPDASSRPYFVTVAPTTIARGEAEPPNAADLEKATDVLIYCAKRRSAILDQLNLMDFIRDNPARFNIPEGGSMSQVITAAHHFQSDLDLIAKCASRAINDSRDAQFPNTFAQAEGTVFPLGQLPIPMPVQISEEGDVLVPNFRECGTWAACVQLAKDSGLKLAYEYQGEVFAPFEVLDFRPAGGSRVAKGSTVTVVCPPERNVFRLRDRPVLAPWVLRQQIGR